MERRSVERFSLPLEAEVRPVSGSTAEGAACRAVTIRDLSSSGAAFYGPETWQEGQTLNIHVGFDQGIASPYSYRLEVSGRVVRTGWDEKTGRAYCAVAFTSAASIRNWRETPTGGDDERVLAT